MFPKLASEKATITARLKSIFGILMSDASFSYRRAFRRTAFTSSILATFGSAIFCCISLTSNASAGIVSLAGHASLPIKLLTCFVSAGVMGDSSCVFLFLSTGTDRTSSKYPFCVSTISLVLTFCFTDRPVNRMSWLFLVIFRGAHFINFFRLSS